VEGDAALGGYLGYLLRRVYVRANQVAAEVMPKGIHPRDYAVLRVLAGRDAYSQQELAEQLGINRTMMVKLVDKLERLGYAMRSRNPEDRRSYQLSVTGAGREAMRRLGPSVALGESRLTEPLSGKEKQRLVELLTRLMPELEGALPRERTGYLLVQAHYRLRRRGDEALGETGLATRHFAALAVLDRVGPCSQQRLAEQMHITEPFAVQLVDHLQSSGLIERGQDPQDRRRYALRLTAEGKRRLDRALHIVGTVEAEVRAALGEEGTQELKALLRKVQAPSLSEPAEKTIAPI
jgi:DNA-binding MarR family transcriptional regulator